MSMSVVEAIKIILQRLGSEALRGAVYWAAGRTADATIGGILAKAAQGAQLTSQEIEALRRALAAYSVQAPSPANVNIDELAMKVVEILRRQGYIK